MNFKSTLINDSDLIIEKPTKFKAISNENNQSELIINGFGISVRATDIKEYFINKDKTLITCSVKQEIQEYAFEQWICYILAMFYKPNHIDEFSNILFDIQLESFRLRNVTNNQKINLKITEDCYEAIPMESEVIIRVLIDNSQLSRAFKY